MTVLMRPTNEINLRGQRSWEAASGRTFKSPHSTCESLTQSGRGQAVHRFNLLNIQRARPRLATSQTTERVTRILISEVDRCGSQRGALVERSAS